MQHITGMLHASQACALFTKSQLYMRRACAHGRPLELVAQPNGQRQTP